MSNELTKLEEEMASELCSTTESLSNYDCRGIAKIILKYASPDKGKSLAKELLTGFKGANEAQKQPPVSDLVWQALEACKRCQSYYNSYVNYECWILLDKALATKSSYVAAGSVPKEVVDILHIIGQETLNYRIKTFAEEALALCNTPYVDPYKELYERVMAQYSDRVSKLVISEARVKELEEKLEERKINLEMNVGTNMLHIQNLENEIIGQSLKIKQLETQRDEAISMLQSSTVAKSLLAIEILKPDTK